MINMSAMPPLPAGFSWDPDTSYIFAIGMAYLLHPPKKSKLRPCRFTDKGFFQMSESRNPTDFSGKFGKRNSLAEAVQYVLTDPGWYNLTLES